MPRFFCVGYHMTKKKKRETGISRSVSFVSISLLEMPTSLQTTDCALECYLQISEISGTAWRKKELKLSEKESSKADSKIHPLILHSTPPHTNTRSLSQTLFLSHTLPVFPIVRASVTLQEALSSKRKNLFPRRHLFCYSTAKLQ